MGQAQDHPQGTQRILRPGLQRRQGSVLVPDGVREGERTRADSVHDVHPQRRHADGKERQEDALNLRLRYFCINEAPLHSPPPGSPSKSH